MKTHNNALCPLCSGFGILPRPLRSKTDQELKSRAAAMLVRNGFSYREAMRLCAYKSTRSVLVAVRKHA